MTVSDARQHCLADVCCESFLPYKSLLAPQLYVYYHQSNLVLQSIAALTGSVNLSTERRSVLGDCLIKRLQLTTCNEKPIFNLHFHSIRKDLRTFKITNRTSIWNGGIS